MVISHNLTAMNAQRQFNIITNSKAKSSEKLSSGYKINRAADDAAGLAISEKMRRQIRGLNQGALNVQDGISLLQVADGALNEVHDMIQRINELSIQAANDTYDEKDRSAIQAEVNQVLTEMDRVFDTTEFNTRKLFKDDGYSGSDSFGYVTGYEIKTETVTRNIETEKQLSFTVSGYSTDSEAKSYTVYLATNGLSINTDSNCLLWSDIKDSNNNPINLNNIKPDTYKFTYNGMTIGINVNENISQSEFADAINNLTWESKITGGGGMYFTTSARKLSFHPVNPNQETGLIHMKGTNHINNGGFYNNSPSFGSGQALLYSEMFNENGKSLIDEPLEAGTTYTGVFDELAQYFKIEISLSVGENNTATFQEIVEKYGKFMGGYIQLNHQTEVTWDDVSDAYETSITADKVTYTPTYIHSEEITEEVTTKIPIYENITPPITDGTGKNLWIQSGAEPSDGMFLALYYMSTEMLGINGLNVSDSDEARNSIGLISPALNRVSSIRANIGSQQNRLEHTYRNVTNTAENTQAAESLIRDTDMANEMVEYSLKNILEQAGVSMMTQANQTNQGVLSLLQ